MKIKWLSLIYLLLLPIGIYTTISPSKNLVRKTEPSIPSNIALDLKLLTRTIHSEAIESSLEDNLAVGTVIMNRLKEDKYDTIKDVVSNGFSGYKNKKWYEPPSRNAKAAAMSVLLGHRSFDNDVLYYLNIKHSTNKKWVRFITKQTLVLKTGNGKWTHSYYKLKQ